MDEIGTAKQTLGLLMELLAAAQKLMMTTYLAVFREADWWRSDEYNAYILSMMQSDSTL